MKNAPLSRAREAANGRSTMVLVQAGRHIVGSEEGSDAERPVREIELEAFWLDENLVTNEQFASFARETGYATFAERSGAAWGWHDGSFKNVPGLSWRSYASRGRGRHPVVLVNWHDAKAYADRSGKRLPTEWEWEVAAAGTGRSRYPWGEGAPDTIECNWRGSSANPPPTSEVGSYPANEGGLFDMVGNVWQWCENVFDAAPDDLPELRARRGGAWNVIQDFRLRCANRGALLATGVAPNLGFRCAMDFG